MSKWEIQGKTYLITGAASGLGAALVAALLEEGAKNVAILDVAEKAGKAKADQMNKTYNNKVLFFKCDVTDEEKVEEAFNETLRAFKKLDVVINNAGILNDSPEYWRKACDVNLKGLVNVTLKGLKHMRTDEGGAGGTIVNIPSLLGIERVPFLPIYSGTKSAVFHFSQCLSANPNYETMGVRILTICFGPTDTALLQNIDKCGYDEKSGKAFDETLKKRYERFQKVESAINGTIDMLKNGTNGSVWVSTEDRPVKNITAVVDEAYKSIERAICA